MFAKRIYSNKIINKCFVWFQTIAKLILQREMIYSIFIKSYELLTLQVNLIILLKISFKINTA